MVRENEAVERGVGEEGEERRGGGGEVKRASIEGQGSRRCGGGAERGVKGGC